MLCQAKNMHYVEKLTDSPIFLRQQKHRQIHPLEFNARVVKESYLIQVIQRVPNMKF